MTQAEKAEAVVTAFQDIVACPKCGHAWPRQLIIDYSPLMAMCVTCRYTMLIVEMAQDRVRFEHVLEVMTLNVSIAVGRLQEQLTRIEYELQERERNRFRLTW